MEEYVCVYMLDSIRSARAVYWAAGLGDAMAAHNSALPQYAACVLKWVGPTGITFHMHDSKITR